MGHTLVPCSIIPKIVKMITKDKQIDELEALDIFYTSPADSAYCDDAMGLYAQSPLYVYNLFNNKHLNLNL